MTQLPSAHLAKTPRRHTKNEYMQQIKICIWHIEITGAEFGTPYFSQTTPNNEGPASKCPIIWMEVSPGDWMWRDQLIFSPEKTSHSVAVLGTTGKSSCCLSWSYSQNELVTADTTEELLPESLYVMIWKEKDNRFVRAWSCNLEPDLPTTYGDNW